MSYLHSPTGLRSELSQNLCYGQWAPVGDDRIPVGFAGLGEVKCPQDGTVGYDVGWDGGKQRFSSCSDLSHLTQVHISVTLQYPELPPLCILY